MGAGPAEATASLTNAATFNLVFDTPGEVALAFGWGLDGIGDAGEFDIDPGDSGFASWDLLWDIEGFDGFAGESQAFDCAVDAAANFGCFNFFDFSEALFFDTLTDDLRLSVSTFMRVDIGVSRAAAVVPEPSALAMMLLSLIWIRRSRRHAPTA